MAETFIWCEDNGTATGSPAKGTTRTEDVDQVNWKNADDAEDTAYSAAPITAGNNSYEKYQFGKFTGTFNQIASAKWAHTAGTCGTGVRLVGKVTSTYATPSTTAMSGSTDMSTASSIGSGASVNFHTTGPEGSSPTSTLSASGYTQYLVTQLQTSGSAAAGDIATLTLTLQYLVN